MNMDIVGKFLHKDFHYALHPKSLGEPTLDKERWVKRMSELGTGYGVGCTTQFSNVIPHTYIPLQQTFHSVIDTPGKVIIHVRIPIFMINLAFI